MTARDVYDVDLSCPKCGATGTATLSELDGWSYIKGDQSVSVDFMPKGFRAVEQKGRPGRLDIECINCSVSARQK